MPDATAERSALDPLAAVIRYHQETKHHFFRYARALGYLDWANQPDPFRRYDGAPLIPLPLLPPEAEPRGPSYDDLYRPGAVPAAPLTPESLSRFLELSLAISAWKQVADVRWSLRMNPSSGNLHPTEGYVLIGPLAGLGDQPALYHCAPKEHGLERRAEYQQASFDALMSPFPARSFLFGLTSIHWREAWKYGERAFRYCQHDAGHAIAAARIAAAVLGWRLVVVSGMSDDQVAALLGVDRSEDFRDAEREHPDCLAVVWPEPAGAASGPDSIPLYLDPSALAKLEAVEWQGRANRLSRDTPVPWEIIDEVAAASWKRDVQMERMSLTAGSPAHGRERPDEAGASQAVSPNLTASRVIRQRRSAVAFDGVTGISAASFFTMMQRVMPESDRPLCRRPMPWDAVPWPPRVHLALFVHRVHDLPPGLYCLVRDPHKIDSLKKAMNPDMGWTPAKSGPSDLPLFQLAEGNAQRVATQVSCHQEIAGDSAFSLGMIAEFEATLREDGPWAYRRLFWETGVIGQVLYLEAEAAGVRATGIGCFFDDPVHEVLGFKGLGFQSLYHFTTGGPVEDRRLSTLPPYPSERYLKSEK